MKLGLSLGYSGAYLNIPLKKVQLAERLGYDSVWTAEAYGSDAITPLAYIAAHTERIWLGTGVIHISPQSSLVSTSDRTDQFAQAGVGLRTWLAERFIFRAEYNGSIVFTSRDENEGVEEWKAGFAFFF